MKPRSSVAFSLHSKMNFKIIVVGEKGVGKTSLVVRYVKDIFNKNYAVTVGVEFYSKTLTIYDEQIALQLWDTAGQQSFKSIVRSFYSLAHCIVIAYSDPKTVERIIEEYKLQINEHAKEGVRIFLARTKIDTQPFSFEQQEEVKRLCQIHNIDSYKSLSAKQNQNINEFFFQMAEFLVTKYHSDPTFKQLVDPKKTSFVITQKTQKQRQEAIRKKKCC